MPKNGGCQRNSSKAERVDAGGPRSHGVRLDMGGVSGAVVQGVSQLENQARTGKLEIKVVRFSATFGC